MHRQPPGRPPWPHGQGFMAATSRKRAGKVTVPTARATRTTPSSSGWRSASRTCWANSASSSRNSTPLHAAEISPGRIVALPPPTSATDDAPWWGARKGAWRTSPPGGSPNPAAEWTRVVSSACRSESGGSRPGSREASIVLPAPGGPSRRRWWPPAAATSRAKRPTGWPRTSARSGTRGTGTAGGEVGPSGHGCSPRRHATTSRQRRDRVDRAAADQPGLVGAGAPTGRRLARRAPP